MTLKTERLESSVALLKQHERQFSQRFYRTLFSDYPQVQPPKPYHQPL